MGTRKNTELQLKMKKVNGHGGARAGAGRPKTSKYVAHTKREVVKGRYPLHITVRFCQGLPNMRTKKMFQIFRRAVVAAKAHGLQVVEFALLGNHYHLMLEADDNSQLNGAMKSLNISLARRMNHLLGRKGAVVSDRFDLKILKTPTQVRNALIYMFANAAKHFKTKQVFCWFSSLAVFRRLDLIAKWRKDLDWRIPKYADSFQEEYIEMLAEPRSWLARVGWERAQGPLLG